jgi:hypothetical protein
MFAGFILYTINRYTSSETVGDSIPINPEFFLSVDGAWKVIDVARLVLPYI